MKHDLSHLRTPEVRERRNKAIRRAWRKRKKLEATNVIPLGDIPGERPPNLRHAVALVPRRRERSEAEDRVELTKGIVALLYKALGGK